ncbi:organic solvent ABC transporter ATP-binding protein [Elioraea sp.]|uniref:organic solvent ABC transporter ATP-binding protein n=1 Tax=Elioraea sp. TaxID=2185103 RepID=UPI00307D7D57
MPDATPLLTLAAARLAIEPAGGLTLPITLEVGAGELVLVEIGGPRRAAAFADAVCGRLAPAEGAVRFLGRDWRAESGETANALRGRIGRHFAADSWLPWLTVAENVLLAALFHTRIARGALLAEAARRARAFGLPGLPAGFPETVAPADLACAALVRAFLGAPRLVVLEHPTGVLGDAILPPLLDAIRAVRDQGGAVLWLTHGSDAAADRSLPATQCWRLVGSRLAPLHAAAA